MLTSLSTACLSHLPLRRVYQLAARAGYSGVELVMAPEAWLRGARYIRELSREFGLPVLTVHQTLLPASPAGRGPRRILDAVEMALELGSRCVVMHATWASRWEERDARKWLEALSHAQRRLEGTDTLLTIENQGIHAESDRASLLAPLPMLIEFSDKHGLGITLDTCHAGSAGLDLGKVYRAVGPRLGNVHLSDVSQEKPRLNVRPVRTLFMHHQMPGEGFLDLAGLLSAIGADGYEGPITVEVSPAALGIWSSRETDERLAKAERFVRRAGSSKGDGLHEDGEVAS